MSSYIFIIFNIFVVLTEQYISGTYNTQVLKTENWKLEMNKNGIRVFTRKTANSSILEFKATADVTTKLGLLEELIENVSDYPSWQTTINTSKVLKNLNKDEQYIYYTIDAPWPVSDRDVVLHSKKNKSADIVRYVLCSKPDLISNKGDFLRIQKAEGYWQFTQGADNKISIIFQFFADPGGNVPDWIINMFIVQGPYDSLMNLKKKVEI